MWPAHCSCRGDTSCKRSFTSYSASRMPTLPWPQMPNTYGTFSLTSVSAISWPPFIIAMALLLRLRPVGCGCRRSCGQRDQTLLAHLAHCVVRALAAEAAVLGAAVRHEVDARAGSLVDVHAAYHQSSRGLQSRVKPVGKQAGGQAIRCGIDPVDRFFQRVE